MSRAPDHASPPVARRCVILLVEDNVETLDMLCRLLIRRGHTVIAARSCSEGRSTARRLKAAGERPDLVIGDIVLPDGDGIEVMREAKACFGCRVVALGCHATAAHVRRTGEAGIDRHLRKPFGIAELDAEILLAVKR
jgi:two-component system KDP operon response regulator KdpE